MMRFWQVTALVCLVASPLLAEQAPVKFEWVSPKVSKSIFSHELGMLDSEREEYATNLATIASNHLALAKATPASVQESRRMIALALQLSPRNRKAVVVNFQLSKGVMPEVTDGNYSPQAFGRLMLSRGQLLAKQGGPDNLKLARYFIQLAAELDPKNEEAVYASEMQRLDQGDADWKSVTDAPESTP